jgi:hypothetical protein
VAHDLEEVAGEGEEKQAVRNFTQHDELAS